MRILLLLLTFIFAFSNNLLGQTVVISQYTETNSGTTPKGIELWNPTTTDIDLSVTNITIEWTNNGNTQTLLTTINSGILQASNVLVVGTSDMIGLSTLCVGGIDENFNFTFNGDDALIVSLNGIVTDVFGIPGSDPGSAWTGGGVSTANQNIKLLPGITTGTTTGFTDPSTRFETVGAGSTLTDFGIPPTGCPAGGCSLSIIEGTAECLTNTNGLDNYSVDFDFTGGNTETYTITPSAGVFSGSDPSSNLSGTFTITNIPEGTDLNLDITSTNCTLNSMVVSPTCVEIPNIVINEFMADPGTINDANGDGDFSSTQDEFVEFYNLGTTAVDLSGYTISDNGTETHTFPTGTFIQAQSFLTVFGGGSVANVIGDAYVASTGSLSLNNSGDDIILKTSGGTEVTSYTYTSEANIDEALGRSPDFTGAFVAASTIAVGSPNFTPNQINTAVLPVKLISLDVINSNSTNTLHWQTATEINNSHFEILHSTDARSYTAIGKELGNGNTTENVSYSYHHHNVKQGTHYYQLKQVDYDGRSETFGPVTVKIEGESINLYPTTTEDVIHFQGELTNEEYKIYNSAGILVQKGQVAFDVNVSSIPSGMYYITFGNQNSQLIKL